jgi:hypothetical protein
MKKRTSLRKKTAERSFSTTKKGRLAEKIVASMHRMPGVKVERNVRLPTLGKSKRKSEIDILLTGNLAGYPIQIAIECKNEKKPIGTPKINSFIGKLNDVGIPTQHGIYVSASGYTTGAVERAEEAGIKPLILEGLTKEGISASVAESFQSVVYLLLEVTEFSVNSKYAEIEPLELIQFYDESGKLCGTIPDLIWQAWMNGYIPASIGEHEQELKLPPNWYPFDKREGAVLSIKVKSRVLGLVVSFSGQVKQHAIINASDRNIEKGQVEVVFNTDVLQVPVTTIYTEIQLQDFLKRPESFTLTVGRMKIPRIRQGPLYWPPSERAAKKVADLMRAFDAGEIPDPRPIDITEIEGTDMRTLWEPIWLGYSTNEN